MVQSDHAPLQKFVHSITKNDKVNNWSQEIHVITPHIEFEHIKGKNNVLADSLSWLRCLDLHDDNDPEWPGQEIWKNHSLKLMKSADQFKINGKQYNLDKHNADNTHASSTSTDSPPHTCHLDPQKLRQLQQQDENITEVIVKCESSKNQWNHLPFGWTQYYIEKSKTNLTSFILLWFPKPCNPIFYMSATMHWYIMVPQDYTISLEEITIGKSYVKVAINMYVPVQNVNR